MKLLMPIFLAALFQTGYATPAVTKEFSSPNGQVRAVVTAGDKLSYQLYFDNKPITASSFIDMSLADGRSLGGTLRVLRSTLRNHRSVIVSPVPEKRKNIPDNYTELLLSFRNGFAVHFRLYNDGFAYRIQTSFNDSIVIKSELAQINFTTAPACVFSAVAPGRQDIFHTSFEEPYHRTALGNIPDTSLLFVPLIASPASLPHIAIAESDVTDYPGMFLKTTASGFAATFAAYPAEEKMIEGEFPQWVVTRRSDFIARTAGKRNFPWRILIIAPADKDLPANDIVYRLAAPPSENDYSWIRPGQSTDEWIINTNIFNVDFKSGVNTATYKYYIDFAKKTGIESVMMDAGWSNNIDLFDINPDVDMRAILSHAKTNGIRINMWTLAETLERQLEPALRRFNDWGVGFIMTDFFDRNDQVAMNRIERIARACERHRIMIMFHGAPPPAGFNRTYPHAITREGVMGAEFNIWSDKVTPAHNVTLPFTRMLSGPMDYEPGILDNGTAKTFRPVEGKVMSIGTRANQLAMYVVYESPVQFFSGNPSQGLLEPAFMELLGSIPTTWDTTIIIDGSIGEFIVTARKSGGDWFVGAMTDSSARNIRLPLGFLDDGTFTATICEDGVNAGKYASDHRIHSREVTGGDVLELRLEAGGGCMLRLKRGAVF